MEGENQGPSPAPAERPPPRHRKWWGVLEAVWDSICDSSGTPLNNYIKTAWPHLRNVVDVLFLFVIGGFVAGLLIRGCSASSKESFLAGQLAERGERIHQLERLIQTLREQNNNDITQLKIDSNEAKRERDAQIAKLTSERDAAQQRLSYFEALPANVVTLYSNLSSLYPSESTNRQQMASLFHRVESLTTNLLQEIQRAPLFTFVACDVPLGKDPCITVPLTNDSYALVVSVQNSGNAPADRLTLTVTVPMALNVTPSPGWSQGAALQSRGDRITYSSDKVYSVEADHIVPANASVIFQPLTLQASNLNRTTDSFILSATAKNSTTFSTPLLIHFTNGIGQARLGY